MSVNSSSPFQRLSEATQTANSEANKKAGEVIGSMRTVRSFACEETECSLFEISLDNTIKINKKKTIVYIGYLWAYMFGKNLVLVVVLLYGGYLVMTGRMLADAIIVFLLYQIQIVENFDVSEIIFK